MYIINITKINLLFLHTITSEHTSNLPYTITPPTIHYQPPYWDKFQEYRSLYNRKYLTEEELETRYKIFFNNYKKMNEFSYHTYAKYMDLTGEEFKNETDSCCLFKSNKDYYLTQYSCTEYEPKYRDISPNEHELNRRRFSQPLIPESLDWRKEGVVTPVKNQGKCGSCWTFSATGAMEGSWALKTGDLISLSEQQLIDCVTQDDGCDGGEMNDAFEYAIQKPMCPDSDDPYEAKDDSCKKCDSDIQFTGCRTIPSNDQLALKEAVALYGPVSVSIEADQSYFQLYTGGIITNPECGNNLDHGVLLVGYGEDPDTNQKYWLVKNSWGSDWGESGYVRIARSDSTNDPGICGIAMEASFPVA